MTLPKHILERVEAEAVKRQIDNNEIHFLIRTGYVEGAQSLYAILTELSEDEEKVIHREANERASRWNVSWANKEWVHDVETFYAGARFGLAMGRMKK